MMKLEYLLTAASVELNSDAISSIAVSVVESVPNKKQRSNSKFLNWFAKNIFIERPKKPRFFDSLMMLKYRAEPISLGPPSSKHQIVLWESMPYIWWKKAYNFLNTDF